MTSFSIFRQHWKNIQEKFMFCFEYFWKYYGKWSICSKILWKMEHLLSWSKCSIFHNIFQYVIFQRLYYWVKGYHYVWMCMFQSNRNTNVHLNKQCRSRFLEANWSGSTLFLILNLVYMLMTIILWCCVFKLIRVNNQSFSFKYLAIKLYGFLNCRKYRTFKGKS